MHHTAPAGTRRPVLVADEVHIADQVASVVEGLGYPVLRASNGAQALRVAAEQRPILALSDVMMPRLRGDALCRRLKTDPATAGAAIVLITRLPPGSFDTERADGDIGKPFDVAHLERVVTRFLDGQRLMTGRVD